MEDHPELDYGSPGALVFYAEKFLGRGYELRLEQSLRRKPSIPTVMMLNRLLNGTSGEDHRAYLVLLRSVPSHPEATPDTRRLAGHCFQQFGSSDEIGDRGN